MGFLLPPGDFIDLIADPIPTPSPPSSSEIERVLAGRSTLTGESIDFVDDYNASCTWGAMLATDGWQLSHTDRDHVGHWVRPGKEAREGTSATVGFGGHDILYVYTTSIPWLPSERAYDKYGYMVHRDHGGDFRVAGRAMRPATPSLTSQTAALLFPAVVAPAAVPALAVVPNSQGEIIDDLLRSLEIDFSPDGPFWNTDETTSEWLIPDFVARGRGHALYAGAKTGKSFLALDAIAAAAIPGHRAWTNVADGEHITVVYLDYEMTEADVRDRLEGFGYGPDDDFSRFHYVRAMAFGSDLDTHEGGAALLAYAQSVGADLVVVDTMSRAVRGDENDADTVRHFYQATGGLLKGHGIALLRLDHAGKTAEKGQRGSSGKNDDVDVVWRLERKEEGQEMTCTHKRMSWVPDTVQIRYEEDENGRVTMRRSDGGGALYPAGVSAKASEMDAAGLPLDVNRVGVRGAGIVGKNDLINKTLRYRRERAELATITAVEGAS
jgi:hypothetical protein